MRREIPVEDLARLYTANDMVKADCGGCIGCSDCCSGMGESIVLDPLDIFRMTQGLKTDFTHLMEISVELNIVDGCILPNLRMIGSTESCIFLSTEGRCTIHAYRPGICRLFPLGRIWNEDGTFRYLLQSHECPKENKTKVKVSKWIDAPQLKSYETYLIRWHALLEHTREVLAKQQDEQLTRELTTYILNTFYAAPYSNTAETAGFETFYNEFEIRAVKYEKLLKIISR